MPFVSAIQRACDLVGGQSELARRCAAIKKRTLTSQAVNRWCRNGEAPIAWVLTIETVCEAQVTRYDLRPDIYPRGH